MTDAQPRPDRQQLPKRQRGFTLIEIIVSLAILVFALTALFQAFSSALRATDATEQQAKAVMLARSLLDRVGEDIPLTAGEKAGVSEDGLHWSIAMSISPLIAPERRAESPLLPFDVVVTVAGRSGQPVVLATLRLAPAASND